MEEFFRFFYEFGTAVLKNLVVILQGIFNGVIGFFNIKLYIDIYRSHSPYFNLVDRITAIISIIVVASIFIFTIYFIYLLIKKYIVFRSTLVGKEDLLLEISDLNMKVAKLIKEKDEVMAMKVSQLGVKISDELGGDVKIPVAVGVAVPAEESSDIPMLPTELRDKTYYTRGRFFRLGEVDYKYRDYAEPKYNTDITLSEICNQYRDFACSEMSLYYDVKIIRLLIAGMASTQMIILQGISGTGKTSLPYSFGKFLQNDTVIAAVQPSWRDRTELFGYFNEFTKKFNETEALRLFYESGFTNDVNFLILDEMNIARVEYYFAEMLSILEMPDHDEWKVELVPNSWEDDPIDIVDGKLKIPENLWYIGTANNDDSTFSVSDKVYDRAMVINIDSKGIPFKAPKTPHLALGYDHLLFLFREAQSKYPLSQEVLDKISHLDLFIIEKIRMAFGNRIIKQMKDFVPVYVACGGTELEAVDYLLANKVIRKMESLNLAFIRDELDNLIEFMDKLFGEENMLDSKAYIKRLKMLF